MRIMPVWMRLKRWREWNSASKSSHHTSAIVLRFLFMILPHERTNNCFHPNTLNCMKSRTMLLLLLLMVIKVIYIHFCAIVCDATANSHPHLNVECRVNVVTDHHNYHKHFLQIFVSFRYHAQVDGMTNWCGKRHERDDLTRTLTSWQLAVQPFECILGWVEGIWDDISRR